MSSFFGPLASQANINLLLNWGPIIGMLTFLLQYWLKWHRSVENTFDLPTVMKLSVGLSVTGSFLRLLPILLSTLYDDISYRQTTFAFCCYHICAILNAASGPLIMGSVSLLSATWFSEEERTTATAVAQTSNGLGTTIGFLNPILFDIKDSTIPSVSRVSYIFYTTAIISVAPLLCIPYIPSKPDHPPSRSQSEKANEVGTETASLKLSSTSFVVLILVCAILSGVSDGWQGCFQSNPVGIDNKAVGWIGFSNCVAGNVAAVVSGVIMDRVFRRRFKAAIVLCLSCALISTMWFTAQIQEWVVSTQTLLVVAISLNGVFKDACSPLFYELAAELIYPMKESMSAGIIVFLLNMSAGVMIFLDSYLDGGGMNYGMCGVLFIVILFVSAFVKEAYKRPSAFFDTQTNNG